MVGANDVNSDHDCDKCKTTVAGVVSEEIQTKPNLDSSTNVINIQITPAITTFLLVSRR